MLTIQSIHVDCRTGFLASSSLELGHSLSWPPTFDLVLWWNISVAESKIWGVPILKTSIDNRFYRRSGGARIFQSR